MFRALICDDEPMERRILRLLIDWRMYGFEIIGEATNGVEALAFIKQHSPSLVLMDISMPGLSGLEVLQQLGKRLPQFACILITGYADFEYARTALRTPNIVDYLLKPIQTDELLAAVMKLHAILSKRERTQPQSASELNPPVNPFHGTPVHMLKADAILEFLNQHYDTQLKLSDIARDMNVSIGRLSFLIKQKLGITFSEYMRTKRMECAASMLINTCFELQEIAEKAGFVDYFYFLRLFKQTYGVSPSRFRKEKGLIMQTHSVN